MPTAVLIAAACLAAAGPGAAPEQAPPPSPKPSPAPSPAPNVFTVTFVTDVHRGRGPLSQALSPVGEISVTVTRSWAPLGADRFHAAVQVGAVTVL